MNPMDSHTGQLDTTIEIVTPENIAFRYRVAGPFRRLLAYLIDLLIRVGVCAAALLALSLLLSLVGLPGLAFGLWLVFCFLVIFFYGGLFETYWNGQTPGKRVMQIRVLTVDGQPIGAFQAILRHLLRAIDAQPFWTYLLGLAAASMNDRFQRLGDLACGTMVVIDEARWFFGVIRVEEPAAIQLAARIPARFRPSRSLARTLAAYVQRRQHFPPDRRMEIAGHLGKPLCRELGLPPGTNVDLLLCALYHRTFIADRDGLPKDRAGSHFGAPQFLKPQAPFAQFDSPDPVNPHPSPLAPGPR